VLVLRDVLGLRAAEVAEMLESSEASVNSALQRARAALDTRPAVRERAPLPGSPQEREIVSRFADLFERGDIDGIAAMLTDDALLTMPPEPLEYEGRDAIAEFFTVVPASLGFERFRFTATRANGQPALLYERGIVVLTLAGDRVAGITRFRREPASAWPGA
jgi:RNA polymerase sigma-70 factor (ECF subfamily)